MIALEVFKKMVPHSLRKIVVLIILETCSCVKNPPACNQDVLTLRSNVINHISNQIHRVLIILETCSSVKNPPCNQNTLDA